MLTMILSFWIDIGTYPSHSMPFQEILAVVFLDAKILLITTKLERECLEAKPLCIDSIKIITWKSCV